MNENINKKNGTVRKELDLLFAGVKDYLDNAYNDMTLALDNTKKVGKFDADSTLVFFRSKERIDNLKLILQYLLYLTSEVDIHTANHDDLVMPFTQFKQSVRYFFSQLLEEDVKKAIYEDYLHIAMDDKEAVAEVNRRIDDTHQRLMRMCDAAVSPVCEDFSILFRALMEYVRYWSELGRNDRKRVRKSYVYIYKLSKILRESL
ncbi:MAG: hypothetical protein GY765_29550 [bacterium]|nr:hypothetical protein [bacterium]